MKKLNKRGFTMVELLATIVIIGILGTVGVVGVTKSIKSAKDRYYVAQNKLFISAAQTYFTDNKSRLPMKSGTSKKVTLKMLNEENYIEKMVDYSKKSYKDDSFVTVTKLGLNMYSYSGKLIDSKGTAQEYKESGDKDAKVTFKIDSTTFSYNTTKYTNIKKDVGIEIEDADGIAGYIISITKRDKTVNEMDYIEVGGATTAKNQITISTDKYGDGEYRVKVKVYDKYNDQKSFTSGKVVVDTIAPKCKIDLEGEPGENGWWKAQDVKVKLSIDELNRDKYDFSNQVLTSPSYKNKDDGNGAVKTQSDTKGITYYAYVIDKAGNKGTCASGDFKVDTEKPTCSIEVTNKPDGQNGWYISPANIKMTSSNDKISEVAARGIGPSTSPNYSGSLESSQQINTTGTAWYGFVKDNAGNVNTCKTEEVKVDTTDPVWVANCQGNPNCQGNGITFTKNNVWINNSVKMGQYFNASVSGIKRINRYRWDGQNWIYLDSADYPGTGEKYTNSYRQTNEYSKEQDNTIGFQLENNAGRRSSVSYVTVKIDKTGPLITVLIDDVRPRGLHNGYCEEKGAVNSGIEEFILFGEEGGDAKTPDFSNADNTSTWQIISSWWTTNAEKSPTYRCKDIAGNYASNANSGNSYTETFYCKCYAADSKGNTVLKRGYTGEEINCFNHDFRIGCLRGTGNFGGKFCFLNDC